VSKYKVRSSNVWFIGSKKILTIVSLIGFLLCVLFLVRDVEKLIVNDFIEYWSAAKAFISGGNPYDSDELLFFQKQGGSNNSQPLMMYNPPWTLALILIFGFFNRSTGQIIWLLTNISILLFSSLEIWKIITNQSSQRWIALLVTFSFISTILVLALGQITPFVLLGLVGLLTFLPNSKYDIASGLSLVLISIKPQLTIIFWFALVFWVVQQRRWLILISGSVILIILIGILSIYNPHLIQQYLGMLQTNQILMWENPTIGSLLRFVWFDNNNFWIHVMPIIFGAIWFIYYWNRKHDTWNWEDEIPILLLVSVLISPFTWTYDYVILVPVILLAASWLFRDRKRQSALLFVGIYLTMNILGLILHTRLSDFWFFWMAPILLVCFLFIRKQYFNSMNSPGVIES
jgi:hypothetical protein